MRKFFLTAFVLSATLVLASSSFALEKTSAKLTDDNRGDGWSSGSTCSVIYYNFCTGWIWIWSGWGFNDVIGVCVESCCASGNQSALDASWHFIHTGVPSGYGFTGTVEVRAADANCCPTGAPLAQQPFLPVGGAFNQFLWGGLSVPSTFVVTMTTGPGEGVNSPLTIQSDHPAVGPTGPQACGFCYPSDRVTHSFYYGTSSTPLCPGSPFFDGVCNAELRWDFALNCTVAVEESSWGSVKNLYR